MPMKDFDDQSFRNDLTNEREARSFEPRLIVVQFDEVNVSHRNKFANLARYRDDDDDSMKTLATFHRQNSIEN